MKALVLEEYNHFVYKDVPEPVLGTDDVMVRVRACGICGSDVHGMDGSTGRRIPPLIMGHEASGVIAGVGSNVNLPLQTVVTGEFTINGSCASRGEYPACLDMIAAGTVDVDPLITAVAPLAEGDRWFQRLYQKEKGLLKVILEP